MWDYLKCQRLLTQVREIIGLYLMFLSISLASPTLVTFVEEKLRVLNHRQYYPPSCLLDTERYHGLAIWMHDFCDMNSAV